MSDPQVQVLGPQLTPFDRIHDGVSTVKDCLDNMRSYARAAEQVGMKTLANELHALIKEAEEAAEDVRAAYNLEWQLREAIAKGEL